MHSQECIDSDIPPGRCQYSIALDMGIELGRWEGHEDKPVQAWVSATTGRLVPYHISWISDE